MGSAPVASDRQTPTGIKLNDGYQTLVTISSDSNISFWEKSVTPPGLDGGDAIETTTMHNTKWKTMTSRALVTLTEMTLTAAYDPVAYDQLRDIINLETTITVNFPDGSTLAFYGFVKGAELAELVEGTQPEMTVTITPTNADPNDHTEQAPVLVEVAGT